ncbi:S24 family peptidase [Flavobacterium alkalisoli]|uniref:S24 family peptidase n=2 Tax=Flavobacterium alkalisoli TaxID=2602769 RepID=A0A5B9G204_9FLAO|nr:S24 family peptidase [Flavobacterium alkalisoli]
MIKTKTANNLTDENSKENGKDFGSKPNMQKNLPYIIEGGDIAEMASDWNEHKKYSRETIKNLQRPDSPNLDRSKGLQVNPYILRTDRRKEMQVIPIYNMEASAGLVHLLDNPNSQNPIDYISIPNLPNCDGALFVTGDSMYPLLKSGDIVAYKNVQDIKNDIFWGEMYLVSLDMSGEELVTIKYVQKSEKAGHIKLVSQNKHHQDKEVRLSKIRALALIKASIRYNLLY